jgi:putative ABC transport system ATP-binding protein
MNVINDIFELVDMQTKMNKYPNQLSGGEQQRVAIARALAKNPSILFCDEPTAALDEEMSYKIFNILYKTNKQRKKTIILITHNSKFKLLADKIITFEENTIKVTENENPISPDELFKINL